METQQMETPEIETQEDNQIEFVPSIVQEFDFQNQVEMDLDFGIDLLELDFGKTDLTDL